jgi:hypothetical protein
MSEIRKKWSGNFPRPEAPDQVLSALVKWVPDSSKKYSTINGLEPNNITAAVAWTKIPPDLVASDAFIYKDRKTKLWIQAVGYPLIPREQVKSWVDLQMVNGAERFWTNRYAQPRLPQKPYTQREIPAKTADKITYIEILGEQNKFMVNGINLLDLNPLGRPRELEIVEGPIKRKTYAKRDPNKFIPRRNSRFIETPKGVYFSISAAAADLGMTFQGLNFHLKKGNPNYRTITEEEYLLRVQELNKNSTTE